MTSSIAKMAELQQTRTNGLDQAARAMSRDRVLEAIAQEETRQARLEGELAESKHRLAGLRVELAVLGAEPEICVRLPVVAESPVPRTSAEKVKLFRALFRGREDVFPTRFVSKKTGKPGYAPACRNKFVQGVCELLRMLEKRLRGYRGIGYAKGEAPLGIVEPGDEILVEYDDGVLRSLREMDHFA
jgi:hypothetical protein